MFEKAARLKLRFPYKGAIGVEDLWDLPVEALDEIYRRLNKELKDLQEDSLLASGKDSGKEKLELQVSILKHIVSVKLAEVKEKETTLAKKEQACLIDEIIAKKENASLEGKTIEELRALKENL
jgi:hypothetical protein